MTFSNREKTLVGNQQTLPNVVISLIASPTSGANNTSDGSGIRNITFTNVALTANRKSFNDRLLIIGQSVSTNANAYISTVSLGSITQNTSDIIHKSNSGGIGLIWGMFDDPGTSTENITFGVIGSGSNVGCSQAAVLRISNIRNAPKSGDGWSSSNGTGAITLPSTYGGLVISTHRDASNTAPSAYAIANGYTELANRISASTFGRGMSIWYKYSSEPVGGILQEYWTPASGNTGTWSWLSLR